MPLALAETIVYTTWTIMGLTAAGSVAYALYQRKKDKEKREDAVPKPPS